MPQKWHPKKCNGQRKIYTADNHVLMKKNRQSRKKNSNPAPSAVKYAPVPSHRNDICTFGLFMFKGNSNSHFCALCVSWHIIGVEGRVKFKRAAVAVDMGLPSRKPRIFQCAARSAVGKSCAFNGTDCNAIHNYSPSFKQNSGLQSQ